jgi:hypothetical protein
MKRASPTWCTVTLAVWESVVIRSSSERGAEDLAAAPAGVDGSGSASATGETTGPATSRTAAVVTAPNGSTPMARRPPPAAIRPRSPASRPEVSIERSCMASTRPPPPLVTWSIRSGLASASSVR